MRTALPPVTAALAILACSPSAKNARTDTAVATPAPAGLSRATATKPSADPSFHPAWSKHAVIYEVNVRQYTPEGTLSALRSHIPRLKALGVDILWLMPVQPIGVKNRKGPLGSYYSIRDYTAINPEFGSEADAKSFIDAAHAAGMRVILDWVANHTAFDHAWAREHLPWHYDHHMGPDQDANWCVTRPWFDQLMGTRRPYAGTEAERLADAKRAKHARDRSAPMTGCLA